MNTTKCPVCDWDINDGGINVKVGGKEITVCCDDCAKKAEAAVCDCVYGKVARSPVRYRER